MSAVGKGHTQKELRQQLLQLLEAKFKEKDLDYFMVSDCSDKVPKGWEAVEIVFRPKDNKQKTSKRSD